MRFDKNRYSVDARAVGRPIKIRVFPNEDSLERPISPLLVEIDDNSAANTKAHIKWQCQNA